MGLKERIRDAGWEIVHANQSAETAGSSVSLRESGLSEGTLGIVARYGGNVWRHQREAVEAFLAGSDVCLSTSTGSGKSLAFYLAGIETIARDPKAKVLAIYPLLALSNEQEARWRNVAQASGSNITVVRIDGSIPIAKREELIQSANVVVMTPDVLHAWMLANLSSGVIKRFVRNVRMVVLDEAHSYTGVFGSNSAFLFMRLVHANRELGGKLNFFAASATIKNPEDHLKRLTTRLFTIIGTDRETAPKFARELLMIQPSTFKNLIDDIGNLIKLVASDGGKFICFADSRKQVEYTSAAIDRADHEVKIEPLHDDDIDISPLCAKGILPYRSGYETQDRENIEKALAEGAIQGVISTSALEMGIDIPGLTVAILVGVPQSATSLQQRIGRVGRNGPGVVIVVNNGSAHSTSLFRHPERITSLPLSESTLYLENRNIQYIHALCLARRGGEHDQVRTAKAGDDDTHVQTTIDMPPGFLELCHMERTGDIPADLREIKGAAGDRPNTTYPLRSIEASFKLIWHRNGMQNSLGTITMPQALREAYPGAVYYHKATPYRVYKVDSRSKEIYVRRDKRYFTRPLCLPTEIYPMPHQGTLYSAVRRGPLVIFESSMQVTQRVSGYEETIGSRKKQVPYPLSGTEGIYWDLGSFPRNFYTTGVCITHPDLQGEEVKIDVLSRALLEAFLMTVPFERHDIDVAHYRLTQEYLGLAKNARFISLYDQHFNSLRLTHKLSEVEVVSEVLRQAVDMLESNPEFESNIETILVARNMLDSAQLAPERLAATNGSGKTVTEHELYQQIIMPGSVGLCPETGLQELEVDNIFFSPKFQELLYRCHPLGQPAGKRNSLQIPLAKLIPVEGRSRVGYYDLDTGELLDNLAS